MTTIGLLLIWDKFSASDNNISDKLQPDESVKKQVLFP